LPALPLENIPTANPIALKANTDLKLSDRKGLDKQREALLTKACTQVINPAACKGGQAIVTI
jgi:hypothetical protein